MLLYFAFCQPKAQAADSIAGAPVLTYDLLENFTHFAEVGAATCQDPLRRLCIRKNGAKRQVKFVRNGTGKFAQHCDAREMRHFITLALRLLFGLLALVYVE